MPAHPVGVPGRVGDGKIRLKIVVPMLAHLLAPGAATQLAQSGTALADQSSIGSAMCRNNGAAQTGFRIAGKRAIRCASGA
jgi:hypothetical protein